MIGRCFWCNTPNVKLGHPKLPCEVCARYMLQGVTVIEAIYIDEEQYEFTGRWWVFPPKTIRLLFEKEYGTEVTLRCIEERMFMLEQKNADELFYDCPIKLPPIEQHSCLLHTDETGKCSICGNQILRKENK